MSTDAWLDTYLADEFVSAAADSAPTCRITAWPLLETSSGQASAANSGGASAEADPRLILGAVLDVLVARGVPVVIDRLDRALEDIGRLLRDLGVEAQDAWTVTP